jgi:hypothetical protein
VQEVFNLLPNLDLQSFVQSMAAKTSDELLVVYLASLIRAVIALHNLINNKVCVCVCVCVCVFAPLLGLFGTCACLLVNPDRAATAGEEAGRERDKE